MSSKAKKMANEIQQPEQKTKSAVYQIDVLIGDMQKTAYMTVTGIPEELPEEYEVTVRAAAQQQFAQVINQKGFLELYPKGTDSDTEKPTFYNLALVEYVKVLDVVKIK